MPIFSPNNSEDDIQQSESVPLLASTRHSDRFSYRPRTCFHRLVSGTIFKSKLRTSEVVTLPYNKFCKFLLILLMLSSGVAFSPDYIPKWLGFFDWRTNSLCPSSRVDQVVRHVHNLARISNLRHVAARHSFEAHCFEQAADAYFGQGWRTQPCLIEDTLHANQQQAKVCVGPTTLSTCSEFSSLKKVLGSVAGICRSVTVPKKCRQTTEASRAAQLLELERERADASILGTSVNDTNSNPGDTNHVWVSNAAVINERGSQIITHVMAEADFASNAYIIYSVLGLLVGTPLVLYKRSKSTRILDVLFGMRKTLFVLVVILIMTFFDALRLANIDFDVIFRAWKDPCGTLDPRVASAKASASLTSCNTVSRLAINATRSLDRMDDIYYAVRRYAVCQDPINHHPMEGRMRWIRQRFRDGDLSFDGKCNVTMLMDTLTTDQADEERGTEGATFKNKIIGLLLGGVVAQLFVKVVFSSWTLHAIAFIDPMVLHSGKVEIWDSTPTGRDDRRIQGRVEPLNERERRSAVGFARDSHLLPLIFLTFALCAQVFLIVVSLGVQKLLPEGLQQQQYEKNIDAVDRVDRSDFQCLVQYP